jgi:hypothetical protein
MIFKEYKGFCERCGKRLETARYTIKLCEHCGMWDDMGIYYLCSFKCWNKLELKDDLDFLSEEDL